MLEDLKKIYKQIGRPRFISLLMIFFVTIPILYPIGIPVVIEDHAKMAFEAVESLPPGSKVAVSGHIMLALWKEAEIGTTAIIAHLFSRQLKIVAWAILPEDAELLHGVFENVPKQDAKYGVDYVLLGFVPGEESALATIASDINAAFDTDFYGNPINTLPLMSEVRDANDFSLIVALSHAPEFYVRQWQSPYNIPVIGVSTGAGTVSYYPYIPQQVVGLVGGSKGGAGYELLIGRPGRGILATDVLNVSLLFLMGSIIAGNISMILEKRKLKGSERK